MKKLLFFLGFLFTTYFISGYTFTNIGTNASVYTIYTDTTNNILYVGGLFDTVNGVSASSIAKFDGTSWSPVGMGVSGNVQSIISFNNDIYVAGLFTNLYDSTTTGLVKWDSAVNNLVGVVISAGGDTIYGYMVDLAVYDSELYVSGSIWSYGDTIYNSIVRFDGSSSWLDVGGGANNDIISMEVFDNHLFVTGHFSQIGGIYLNEIAKWNGSNWDTVGNAVDSFMFCPGASCGKGILGQHSGSLYVFSVCYVPINIIQDSSNVFKLTGNQWGSVNGLVEAYDWGWGCLESSTYATQIISFDGGFVVGGYFSSSDPWIPSPVGNNIVMFKNNSWDSLSGGANGGISSLAVYNGELYIGGYSFDSIGGIACQNFAKLSFSSPLPLELLSFTGENKGDINVLKWETASEVDIDYYLIEKSNDGISFEELDKVPASGYSNFNTYQLVDDNPKEGITYYRLTEISFDGKRGYSDIVAVRKEGDSFIKIYPNIIDDEFTVTINSEEEMVLHIFNLIGQKVKTLYITEKTTVISRDTLPSGVYFYQIGGEKGKLVFR